jgi:putative transposase
MPAKNSSKIYVEGGYYHIYNRGVEKREIFLNTQDYSVFLDYLKEYLSPKDENVLYKKANDPGTSALERARLIRKINLKNYNSEIYLLAYCLMPNHFHLFLKQHTSDAIDRLMSSLCTRYTMYFNRRHNRVGRLYQGVYKAVLVTEESQYLHITRYIHKQTLARSSEQGRNFPSSYPEYLGLRKTDWVHTDELLSFFSSSNPALSYERFILEYNPSDEEMI